MPKLRSLHPEQHKRVRHSKRFWILAIALSVALTCALVVLILFKTVNPVSQALYDRYLNIGRESVEGGNYERAVAMYRRALSLPNSDGSEWKKLAFAYQANKDYEESAEAYQQALAHEPESATSTRSISTYNVLGNVYRNQGKYEEAKHYYYEALSLKPDYVTALVNLAHVLKIEQKYDEAIELLSKNYDGTATMKDVGLQLAVLYKETGKTSEAKAVLEQILAVSPNDGQAVAVRDTL